MFVLFFGAFVIYAQEWAVGPFSRIAIAQFLLRLPSSCDSQ